MFIQVPSQVFAGRFVLGKSFFFFPSLFLNIFLVVVWQISIISLTWLGWAPIDTHKPTCFTSHRFWVEQRFDSEKQFKIERCPMCPIGVTQLRCRFGAVRGQLLQKILLILSLKTFFPCHFLVATIERIVLLYSCQLQRCTRKTTADTHVHNWVEQCRSFQMQSLNIVEKNVETCWQGMQGQIYDFWTCLQIQMDV